MSTTRCRSDRARFRPAPSVGGERGARLRWKLFVRVAAIAAFLATATMRVGSAAAEPERPSVEIGWTQTPPRIDGRLDPGEWSEAGHIDGLTQASPDEGARPTQRTEVFIMTDDDFLYIAARMWDTNPEEIVAFAMSRDQNMRNDDRFNFSIDPFLDRQNGYFFQVNPNGARRDFLIEANGGDPNWDGLWYAKASVDDEGWTAEIALPYATINFDPDANVWGLNISRGIRRRDEIDRWADPVRERFLIAMGRAGNLVGMKGVQQGLGLQLVPSATVRRVDDAEDPPVDVDDRRRHYTRFDPSFDLFYKVTPSVTTALTVNTDFGDTEVDERQVNLDRFALFFPEKRDFFLQDALIFNFGDLNQNGRPFFSRRIGLDEDGNAEDILAGGKVTGRLGPIKFGALNVVLDERDQVDRQNLFVARAAANIGESSVGLIATHGDPEAAGDNALIGTDFLYQNTNFGAGQTLRGSLFFQGTYNDPDRGPSFDPEDVDGLGYAFGGSLSYPNDRVNWQLFSRVFDEDFDPALGFANRVGIREYGANYRFRWRPEGDSIQTIDTGIESFLITEQGRQVESGSFLWRAIDIRSPIDDSIRLAYRHRYEVVDSEFENLDVALGRYHFDEGFIRLAASPNRPIAGNLLVGYGTFFDGKRLQTRSELNIRFHKKVQTSIVYGFDDIRLPGGDEIVHLLRARLNLLFTPDISWVTLVQFDNVSDTIGVNSRFRWIIEDGREVFLVLNQGFDSRDGVRPTRTAPLAKLQWTFRF
jgi:hypothetical protein